MVLDEIDELCDMIKGLDTQLTELNFTKETSKIKRI